MMSDDMALVREFAASHSEPAFATLVQRHLGLVHSAALRQVGDAHLAEAIAQAVFLILARKAPSLGPKTILSAWLYRTTRYAAGDALKANRRRQAREQEAYMQSTLNQPDADTWAQLAPLLDDAMAELGETDRAALVLRFFENKTVGEIAGALRMEEAAAQKRVGRALEKLRKIFSKRGVTLSATLIASAVSVNSVMAAPIGLAAAVTATAARGTLIPATITTLVKGTMKTMTWLKIKFGVGVVVAALVAVGALTMAVSQASSSDRKFSGDVIFQKSQDAYAALTSYSDEGKTVTTLNDAILTNAFSMKLARPNLYRIEWGQPVLASSYTNKGVVWSAGKGDFLIMGDRMAVQLESIATALSSASGISGVASPSIAGTFFKMNWSNHYGAFTASREQKPDEKFGNVDCYVFMGEAGKGVIKTIWIGKQDFLIRQVRDAVSPASVKATMAEAAKHHPRVAAQMLKMRFGHTTSTETHENIVVNQKFSPEEFAR